MEKNSDRGRWLAEMLLSHNFSTNSRIQSSSAAILQTHNKENVKTAKLDTLKDLFESIEHVLAVADVVKVAKHRINISTKAGWNAALPAFSVDTICD